MKRKHIENKGVFKSHQSYEAPGDAKQVICDECGGDRFYVGSGNQITFIKCPTCGWEECVHDG